MSKSVFQQSFAAAALTLLLAGAGLRTAAAAGPGFAGLPPITQLLAHSFEDAGIGATLTDERDLYENFVGKVYLPAQARVDLRIDAGGIYIGATPDLVVEIPGPDFHFSAMRYDFEDAEFKTTGEFNYDWLGLNSFVIRELVEGVMNYKIKPLLPAAVQEENYRPYADENLPETIQQAAGVLKAFRRADSVGLTGLSDLSGYAGLKMSDEYVVPLPEELRLVFRKDALVHFDVETTGPATAPRFKMLRLRNLNGRDSVSGIYIESTKDGPFSSLRAMRVKSVSVLPGGKFAFEYDLVPEELVNGVLGLMAVAGTALEYGEWPRGPLPQLQIDSVHEHVNARLDAGLREHFPGFLKQFDGVIPGFSLLQIYRSGSEGAITTSVAP